MALTTNDFLKCALRNEILAFISFNQVLKALSDNEFNLAYLQQVWRLSSIEKLEHLPLEKLHW